MPTTYAHRPTKVKPRTSTAASKRTYPLNRRLMTAAMAGDVPVVVELLSRGANADFQNRAGETPLASAAAWAMADVVKVLLARGADPSRADRSGGTPLMLAAQHGSLATVRLLLRHGADPSARDSGGSDATAHAGWRASDDEEAEAIRRALLAACRTRNVNPI